jgi:hypothetical protein
MFAYPNSVILIYALLLFFEFPFSSTPVSWLQLLKMGLINKICRCHQIGLTREGTFDFLCSEQNLLPISTPIILQWFKALDKNSDAGIDSSSIYYVFLKKIHREFEQFQSTIFAWPKTGGSCHSFCLLDSRYSLAACGTYVPADLYLLDNYHGQMRLENIVLYRLKIHRK